MKTKLILFVALCVIGATVLLARVMLHRSAPTKSKFVAFSLREAERMLTEDPNGSATVKKMGGMCRLVGLVYDRAGKDPIVIGQIGGDRGVSLDDLVVAIRARLLEHAWPLVSIDKTQDTVRTGMQFVRFEGGVSGSQYGDDLLLADIALKRTALGLNSTAYPWLKTYVAMSSEDASSDTDLHDVSTRFWFVPMKAAITTREDVFAIQDLVIGVKAQVMNSSGPRRDPAGERFSTLLTTHYSELSAALPEVGRLQALFDLAGVAEGIHSLSGQPDMSYWLSRYKLPAVQTPSAQPLLKKEIGVSTRRGHRTMTIDGGIELRALLSSLRGGDVTALRDLVLKSRPSARALSWSVPLTGWAIPGATPESPVQDENIESPASANLGAFLSKSFGDAVGSAVGSIHTITFPTTNLNDLAPQVQFNPHTQPNSSGSTGPFQKPTPLSTSPDSSQFNSPSDKLNGVKLDSKPVNAGVGGGSEVRAIKGATPSPDGVSRRYRIP